MHFKYSNAEHTYIEDGKSLREMEEEMQNGELSE